MIIKIQNNLNLSATLNSICERLGIGYAALDARTIRDMAKHSETMLAIFPENLKPGAVFQHHNGGATITMMRRQVGWFISDVRVNYMNETGLRQRLTGHQKAFLEQIDDMAA